MGYEIDRYKINLYCRCLDCKKYKPSKIPYSCKAFPKRNGIPQKVWNGRDAKCKYFEENQER